MPSDILPGESCQFKVSAMSDDHSIRARLFYLILAMQGKKLTENLI